ncbi:MAG: UDP-N-acetylmuramate--L-alanine ligase [Candidatus Binatia bacterium]
MSERTVRVHFVGVGGIGMSGIAEVLLNLGYCVSGSDLAEGENTRRLKHLGATVHIGAHDAAHITDDIDVCVISSAVTFSNPEVLRARDLAIPVIPRAEMLAELMRMKRGVAVAGSHGKTTTTSLVAAILREAGVDPTVVVGGKLNALGTNARLGQGEILVAEADESDGTFLLLSPTIAVVTNIDREHLDYYGDMDRLRDAYLQFIHRVPFYGRAVLCLDNVNVRGLLPQVRKRFVTYGISPDADWQARELRVEGFETHFEVWRRGEALGEVRLRMPGRHYALNALAALAVGDELGVSFAVAARALGEFGGVGRRFDVRGEERHVLVIDDYGHHPAEVRATLRAAREGFSRRLVVAFQPHRYSRTKDLFADFLEAFDDAHVLFLTDVYAAGEERIDGVSGEALFQALKRRGHLDVRFASRTELTEALLEAVRPGDLLLTLGAGDVWRVAEEILSLLRAGAPLQQIH